MPDWKSYLKNNTLEWLLEENNPSVRYFTLLNLQNKKSNSAEVNETRKKIMREGQVPKILGKQNKEGYWGDPLDYYLPKGKATVFQFYSLVDFGADETDGRIKSTCEYLLKNSQHKESGAFSNHSWDRLRIISKKSPKPSERVLLKNLGAFPGNLSGGSSVVIPCLTGQILYSMIQCGYLDDPRVQKGIDWIVKYLRFDDGETMPAKEWPYKLPILHNGDSCWGKHTCHTGVVLCLKALAEIPKAKRSTGVKRVITEASEHILRHHIYKRSRDLNKVSIAGWMKLGYPQLDFLSVLHILAGLGYKDDRMQDAVDLLVKKQNNNGRWIAEKPGYDKKGMESKWVTLFALNSLKYIYG